MALCDTCGQALPETYIKGDIIIRTNPAEALWRGERIPTTPTRVMLLRLLAQLGRASTSALIMALPRAASDEATVKVHISLLRAALRQIDAGLEVRSIYGWGYELIWRENSHA